MFPLPDQIGTLGAGAVAIRPRARQVPSAGGVRSTAGCVRAGAAGASGGGEAVSAAIRILSLGGGVQSCYLALASPEAFDFAVFADTGSERPDTYAYLAEIIAPRIGAKLVRVGILGGLEAVKLQGVPGYTLIDGKRGMRRRSCTDHFKIRPIRRWLRAQGVKRAEMLLGISCDEVQRMRDSDVRWITNAYPLIDAGLTRADCVRWFELNGLPVPPKSSCYFCPFHTPAYWEEMAATDPISYAKAQRAEELSGAFLTVSRRPLGAPVPLPLFDTREEAGACGGHCHS